MPDFTINNNGNKNKLKTVKIKILITSSRFIFKEKKIQKIKIKKIKITTSLLMGKKNLKITELYLRQIMIIKNLNKFLKYLSLI